MIELSVIVCSHNPRAEYLQRTIDGLKKQTLPCSEWEFLLVDNSSSDPISARFDLSWHPNGRHILEEELGLTPARVRGIKEAQGGLLLFVDDDNVLAENYLEEALAIAQENPRIGVFGGSCIGEFEQEPTPDVRPFLGYIAVREVKEAKSDDSVSWRENMPFGAGMVLRAEVGQAYCNDLDDHPVLRKMDRRGKSLASSGDTNLIYVGHRIGYASGLFPSLKLRHLIASNRVTEDYMSRLMREATASLILLEYVHFERLPKVRKGLLAKLGLVRRWLKARSRSAFAARMLVAQREGQLKGLRRIQELI